LLLLKLSVSIAVTHEGIPVFLFGLLSSTSKLGSLRLTLSAFKKEASRWKNGKLQQLYKKEEKKS
jgi:hypothetical protein